MRQTTSVAIVIFPKAGHLVTKTKKTNTINARTKDIIILERRTMYHHLGKVCAKVSKGGRRFL